LPRLPVLSAREIIAALTRGGFVVARTQGSHVILVHRDRERAAVVPIHGGRDVPPGTSRRILRQAGMTVDEFLSLRESHGNS